MNLRAYAFGVVAVALSMAATVLTRTYTDALFLSTWGGRGVPVLLATSTGGFVVATFLYGVATRRFSPRVVDPILSALLVALLFAAPGLAAAGKGALLATAVALLALASLASLAAWNAVATTVRGRTARRLLPRAGAAATFGAVVAGFSGTALVTRAGVGVLPAVVAALVACTFGAGVGLVRAQAGRPLPPPAAPRRAHRLAGAARTLTTWLVIAALGESMAGAVAEFLFKSTLADSYGRREIAAFVSTYQGVTNLGVLVLQVFAVPRILATRSLVVSASAHPLGLAAALVLGVLAPGLATLAAARTLDQVLKFSLSRASQEVSLSPLAPPDAARWKVLLRGGATQVGAAAVALALMALPAALLHERRALAVAGLVLTAAWLFAVRRATRAYLESLAATLGMRRLALDGERQSDTDLDREGFRVLVELAAHDDPAAARVGQTLLAQACRRGGELVPHLAHPRPAVRRAVYAQLERAPDPAAAPALRRAVLAEQDEVALGAGLYALGAARDDGAVTRAKVVDGAAAGAARAYLAELGQLAPDAAWAAFRAELGRDGLRAARLARAELARGRVDAARLAGAVDAAMGASEPAARREACRAAAATAADLPPRGLVTALSAGEPGAAAAVAEADGRALARIAGAAAELAGAAGARARVRLCRALRQSGAPEAGDVLAALLDDDDATVREAAARSLGKLSRERRAEVPPAVLERATARELDRLARYVAARAPAGVRPAWHEDELARQTAWCLERVLALVALAGNPATVAAVARRLRDADGPGPEAERERRGALDLLQEVARGETRRRMLALVEALLAPPEAAPAPEAEAAVRALDPWLADVLGGELDRREPGGAWRLAALRRTRLFDDVPGAALAELAAAAAPVALAAGAVVVREGDPGDALYVVDAGRLRMRRGGDADVGELVPGDAFGELALIDGQPRTATVIVEADARLLRLPRDTFDAALAARPEIALGLLRALARWLRRGSASPAVRGVR